MRAKVDNMNERRQPTAGIRADCRLGVWAAVAAGLAVLAIAGCGLRGPSPQQLRAALVKQVRADDAEYNRRVDRWQEPKPDPDGSVYSSTRMHRSLAVRPAQIRIQQVKGRTTVWQAEVPRTVQTYIKTGSSPEECQAAPERKLEPQRNVTKYEYDTVREKWQAIMPGVGGLGSLGGLLGN